MNFHSFEFLAFFALVLTVYWTLPLRPQNWFLLVGSYVFYGWADWRYLFLIFAVTCMDYTAARLIVREPQRKKFWLIVALVFDFGMLAYFKYMNFFVDSFSDALIALGMLPTPWVTDILLPVGISFYVFQGAAYVIDSYRGTGKPTRNFLNYALFASYFPQLIAGPIERSPHLLSQLEKPRRYVPEEVRSGLLLLLWGFFKKLVIADNVAVICNRHFSTETTNWPMLWAGVLAFGVQIYADFAAYSDIARGLARMMGVNLIRNFNFPYLSRSPSEFWRRWHISLSTWFRDYVYIPLGGNRISAFMEYRNLMITFLLSGLWHGASWNFVFWGGFHGLLIVGERIMQRLGWIDPKAKSPWRDGLGWLFTFIAVHVGWLLFREARSFDYLMYYLTLSPMGVPAIYWQLAASYLIVVGFYSIPLWIEPWAESRWPAWKDKLRFETQPLAGRMSMEIAAGVVLFCGILLFGSNVTGDFIYFQF